MLKRLDSLSLYIKNVGETAKFYGLLGFEVVKQTDTICIAKLGDFELHCHDQNTVEFKEESKIEPKGAGVFIYTAVERIDEYYRNLLEKGLKPSSEPRDWPWGNREFVIRDPDGYKIVFYEQVRKA